MGKYIKYGNCNLLGILTLACLFAGGPWLWLPLFVILAVSTLGDALAPEDQDFSEYKHPWILNAFLFLNLPLLLASHLLFFWHLAPDDFLKLGALGQNFLGWTPELVKARTAPEHLLGAFLGLGLMYGIAGTNVAHELVHRTWNSWAMETGRWLLAFTWDAAFAIEHVYGHHRNIATFIDPASARRGENTFAFILRSTLGSNRSAWTIEQRFLRRKERSLFSWHNRLLRGWSYSAILALSAYAAVGWRGLLLHTILSFYGKAYLELVNFIEHYGLARVPKTPVQPRHSWNSNACISTSFLYNLTRHSHHHETGHLPFWRLKPMPYAPKLPYGYMTMILLALCPPLFRKVMAPALDAWDRDHATPDEQRLARALIQEELLTDSGT